MFSHFKEDLAAHREGLLAQGFWALEIYRFAAFRRRLPRGPIRFLVSVVQVFLEKFSQVAFGIYIGRNATLGRRITIEHFGGIIVHSDVVMGDDIVLRQDVTIGNRHMDRPRDVPQLGSRIEVGAGARILGPVRIGNDVAIGANAVVLVDVPDGHYAVGVPATVHPRKGFVAAIEKVS